MYPYPSTPIETANFNEGVVQHLKGHHKYRETHGFETSCSQFQRKKATSMDLFVIFFFIGHFLSKSLIFLNMYHIGEELRRLAFVNLNNKEKHPWQNHNWALVCDPGTLEGPNQTNNGPTLSLPKSPLPYKVAIPGTIMWSNYTTTDVHPMSSILDHTHFLSLKHDKKV